MSSRTAGGFLEDDGESWRGWGSGCVMQAGPGQVGHLQGDWTRCQETKERPMHLQL